MSTEQHSLVNFVLNIDGVKDEEFDANDLEVALINESFEEQQKHSQLFCDMKLKSLFYGEEESIEALKENQQQPCPFPINKIVEENLELKLSPLPFLPHNTLPNFDEDDAERGRQLDQELGRMMLDEEDNLSSDSPLPLLNLAEKTTIACNDSAFMTGQNSFFTSFESQAEQDIECADAEAIAIDVIEALFADEQCTDPSSTTYEDNDMLVSANILKILQDDDEYDSNSVGMEDDPKMERSDLQTATMKSEHAFDEDDLLPPPPRNDSLHTIASPMSTSCLSADEQTVPVIEHWEELDEEPYAAEKISIDAKAMLKKIRAERKATQL